MKIFLIAALLTASPAWSAQKKSAEALIEESGKAADSIAAAAAGEEAARQLELERYWDAQPEAPAVVPGQLLANLRKLPWPDPRPVPKEKYLERPEVKARELTGEEGDPLLAGLDAKESGIKSELEAARKASDDARYDLWLENFGFYMRAINDCESGRTSGAERVKILEGMQAFLKEGEPRFYLRETGEKAAGTLPGLAERSKLLVAELYRKGEYIPNYKDLLWAERMGGQISGGLSGAAAKDKQRYYKIVARVRAFDPRALQAEGQGGAPKAAAPAAGQARDEKWEKFLAGLVPQCNAAISSMDFQSLNPDYRLAVNKQAAAVKGMLESFPPGWEDYPRAKWARGWFSSAVEKAGKETSDAGRAMELFKALDNYEAGLKAGR